MTGLPNYSTAADLNTNMPRVLHRIEDHFREHDISNNRFNEPAPAASVWAVRLPG